MMVTEEDAREAWLAAHESRLAHAKLIADQVADGRNVSEQSVKWYRRECAVEEATSAAYDRHLHMVGRVSKDTQ